MEANWLYDMLCEAMSSKVPDICPAQGLYAVYLLQPNDLDSNVIAGSPLSKFTCDTHPVKVVFRMVSEVKQFTFL